MKIGEYSPVGKAGQIGKKKSVSASGDFLGLLNASEVDASTPISPPSDIASVASVDALLSLQEIPDDEIFKRKAVEQGSSAIDILDDLRIALLTGNINEGVLAQLKNISNLKKSFANDKRLSDIINDIELRAAVELAKLERSTN